MPQEIRSSEINVIKCVLRNASGSASVDITLLFDEINISENIFNNTLSGYLVISEVLGIRAHFPLVGQEYLDLRIEVNQTFASGPSTSAVIDHTFAITKIGEEMVEGQGSMYVLGFTTQQMIDNQQKRISRSFDTTSPTDMVSMLFSEINNTAQLANYQFDAAQSFPHDVIIPKWTPLYAINWLAKRTLTQYGDIPDFLFFETLDPTGGTKFNFRSLSILKTQAVRSNIRRTLINTAGIRENQQQLEGYVINRNSNLLDQISKGIYSSRLITHDIIHKKFQDKHVTDDTVFNYSEEFGQRSDAGVIGANENPIIPVDDPNKYFSADSVVLYGSTSNGFNDDPTHIDQWLQRRLSLLKQIENTKVRVQLPGNMSIITGDTINLFVPAPGYYGAEIGVDPYLTGKYLVTGLRHRIRHQEYKTVYELSRDTFNLPLKKNKTFEVNPG